MRKVPARNDPEPQQFTMRSIPRTIQPLYTPFIHPKHASRIQSSLVTPRLSWARSFHASSSLRVIDLAYSLHDNKGSAKGDPIVIIHGLFGSKKNNRSVSKYVGPVPAGVLRSNHIIVHSHAPSTAQSTPLTRETTATPRTTKSTTILPSPTMSKPS
jgi:hypothetical protein